MSAPLSPGYKAGYAAAIRDAIAAIDADRDERQPLHFWDGMKRAISAIEAMDWDVSCVRCDGDGYAADGGNCQRCGGGGKEQ